MMKILKFGLIFLLVLFSGTRQTFGQHILALNQALEIATEKSPDMQTAGLSLERNQHLLQAEKAALKSQFALSLTPYNYSKDQRFNTLFNLWNTEEMRQSSGILAMTQRLKWTDGTVKLINRTSWQEASSEFQQTESKTTFNNNLYLSFEQPIFTYNQTKLTYKQLELNLENAQLNYAMKKLQIEKQVTQYFYDLFYQQQSLEITREEAKNNAASYNIIKNKVEAGISAQEELYQAELNLANSHSSVANAEIEVENAKDNLKDILGISLYDEVEVLAEVEHREIPVNLAQALKQGLETRMELRQAEINIQNELDEMTRTSAQNEFKGNLNVSYGIIGTHEKFNDIFADPTQNQQIEVSLEIPLWDWGEKKSRIKAQETSIKQTHIDYSNQENQIIIGIRETVRQVNYQLLQIDIRKKNVKNAQLTYDLNLERYKNGDLSSKLLGDYQTQLSREKLGLLQAQIQYRLALLDLKIQSLWDFETQHPVLK
jgi:outer membrane protein TolC